MTEKLSSSNPSWGPCTRKNKTKRKKKKVGRLEGRSRLWHEVAVASEPHQCNRFGFRTKSPGRRRPGGRGGVRQGSFPAVRRRLRLHGGSSGSKLSIVNTKREGRYRRTESFSPPLTYRVESARGGGTSFYLPGWGEFQRAELSSPRPAALVWKLAYCHVWLKLFFLFLLFS